MTPSDVTDTLYGPIFAFAHCEYLAGHNDCGNVHIFTKGTEELNIDVLTEPRM